MTDAIILAGGLGTRLKKLVSDVPKPMARIRDKPFLSYLMDYWIGEGVTRFVLSVGYKYEKIIELYGDEYRGAHIEYAVEETPLGTGGGLLNAIRLCHVKSPVLVLNGDTMFPIDLELSRKFMRSTDAGFLISLYRTDSEKRYSSVTLSENGRITEIKSEVDSQDILVNGGVYLVNIEKLESWAGLGRNISLENEIIPYLIMNSKCVHGLEHKTKFLDIGLPKDFLSSESFLNTKNY